MKKRFSEEQIIGFLKQAEAGVPARELCRQHGFNDASFYNWRAKYGATQSGRIARTSCISNSSLTGGLWSPAGLPVQCSSSPTARRALLFGH